MQEKISRLPLLMELIAAVSLPSDTLRPIRGRNELSVGIANKRERKNPLPLLMDFDCRRFVTE